MALYTKGDLLIHVTEKVMMMGSYWVWSHQHQVCLSMIYLPPTHTPHQSLCRLARYAS